MKRMNERKTVRDVGAALIAILIVALCAGVAGAAEIHRLIPGNFSKVGMFVACVEHAPDHLAEAVVCCQTFWHGSRHDPGKGKLLSDLRCGDVPFAEIDLVENGD